MKEERIYHIKEKDLNKLKETSKKKKELERGNRELKKKLEELKDRYLRLAAEFDNFRKRIEKEKQEIYKYGAQNLFRQLLQFDSIFETVLKQMEKSPSPEIIHQGVELLKKEFTKFLEENGVKRIETIGKKFDPAVHEATGVVETDKYEEGEIVEEEQPGYVFHDIVLKPPVVKIAKRPKSDENSGSSKD